MIIPNYFRFISPDVGCYPILELHLVADPLGVPVG
jgi:hypothetical protein